MSMSARQADSGSTSSGRVGAETVTATTQAMVNLLANMSWLSGGERSANRAAASKPRAVITTADNLRTEEAKRRVVDTADSLSSTQNTAESNRTTQSYPAQNIAQTEHIQEIDAVQLTKEYQAIVRRLGEDNGSQKLTRSEKIRLAERANAIVSQVGPEELAYHIGIGATAVSSDQKLTNKKVAKEENLAQNHRTKLQEPKVTNKSATGRMETYKDDRVQPSDGNRRKKDVVFEVTQNLLDDSDQTQAPINATPLQPVDEASYQQVPEAQDSAIQETRKQNSEAQNRFDSEADSAAPVTTTSVVYSAEDFNISKEGKTVTITDKFSNAVLFQYTQDGKETKVIKDLITNDPERFKVFKQAHANINKHTASTILSDPRGINQVNNLQGLAPEGSHAVALAHTYLEAEKAELAEPQLENGKEKYEFKKTREGYRISHLHTTTDGKRKDIPPREQIVITSKGSSILIGKKGGLTKQDALLFRTHYHALTKKIEERKAAKAVEDANARKPKLNRNNGGR
ncbi:MAG: hypothetical protein AAFV90_24170 [Cyanobacteria bacterium J06634_5]